MARWHGCWLIAMWLVLPGVISAQEPQRISRAAQASDISKANEPLRLARPGSGSSSSAGTVDSTRSQPKGWITTTVSLMFVLALIAGGAYLISRQGRRFAGLLPEDVVQVLGRRYIDQRQSIQLIRCGSKILVLSNSTQHGLTTLAEISDPLEVQRITAQCLPHRDANSTNAPDRLRADSPDIYSPSPTLTAAHSGAVRHVHSPTGQGGTRG